MCIIPVSNVSRPLRAGVGSAASATHLDPADRRLSVHGKGSICKRCFGGFQSLVAHPCLVVCWVEL